MTRFTCCMSSAIGASRLAALEEGVAVDDMMAELGSAANYKANRGSSGSQSAARRVRGGGPGRARMRCGKAPGAAHGHSQRVLTEQLTLCIITGFRARCVGKMNTE